MAGEPTTSPDTPAAPGWLKTLGFSRSLLTRISCRFRSGFALTSATTGKHGARSFPICEKWEDLTEQKPRAVQNPKLAEQLSSDLSNDPNTGIRTRLTRAGKTSPEPGCQIDLFDVFVEDSQSGRTINAENYPGAKGSPLLSVARRHTFLTLTGVHRWPKSEDCSVAIVWAGL